MQANGESTSVPVAYDPHLMAGLPPTVATTAPVTAPGSAGSQPRKRGRPPTKNRSSLPPAALSNDSPLCLTNTGTEPFASPQYLNPTNTNGMFMSPSIDTPVGMINPTVTTSDKPKRQRRVDDHQLTIPFEIGWNRIVRFRWQPPGPQVMAEVTYKSPAGRIFRSYTKINEYLTNEQANILQQTGTLQVNALKPENFSFSSRTRIPGTTYQKTTINNQGTKEYREMQPEEVDLLLTTMSETSRNKMSNPIPVYEQIFGVYQPPENLSYDGINGGVVQDFSMKQPQVNCRPADVNAVNLSGSGGRQKGQQILTNTPIGSATNLTVQSTVGGDAKQQKITSSTLAASNNLAPVTNTFFTAGGSVGGPAAGITGSADEQQAMLMFMTAMFMQQQQAAMTMPVAGSTVTGMDLPALPKRDDGGLPFSTANNENNWASSEPSNMAKQPEVTTGNLSAPTNANPAGKPLDSLQQPSTCQLNKTTESDQTSKKPETTIGPSSATMLAFDRDYRKMQKRRKRQQERRLKVTELKQELNRQPADDMILIQRRTLPEFSRFACYSLLAPSSQAIADCLQVFEFVQTFANVLGLDVKGLPSLACMERGIAAADRQSLLEVTDLLCRLVALGLQDDTNWLEGAVSDLATKLHPELDHRHHHHHNAGSTGTTIDDDSELWQRLPKLPIDRTTVSEASRQFLFVRNSGKQTSETELLAEHYFQAMEPFQRARILAAICDELLGYEVIMGEIEQSIAKSVELKRDLVNIQSQLKVIQQLSTPVAAPSKSTEADSSPKKAGEDIEEEKDDKTGVSEKVNATEAEACEDLGEKMETTGGEDAAVKNKAAAELKKLTRQEKTCKNRLVDAITHVRAQHIGLDRFGRSYWSLPHVGVLLIHGSDFSKPFSTNFNTPSEDSKIMDNKPEDADTEKAAAVDDTAVLPDEKAVDKMETEVVAVKVEEATAAVEDVTIPTTNDCTGHATTPTVDVIPMTEDAEPVENLASKEDGSSTTLAIENSEQDFDEIEQARWSPPPNLQSQQQQIQQQLLAGQQIASTSPRVARRKNPASRVRKNPAANYNTSSPMDLSRPIGNQSGVDNTAMPAHIPQEQQQQPQPQQTDSGSTNGTVTVTVDPGVLLHNFLMLAKSFNMPGMSAPPLQQPMLGGVNLPPLSQPVEQPAAILKIPTETIVEQMQVGNVDDMDDNTKSAVDATSTTVKPVHHVHFEDELPKKADAVEDKNSLEAAPAPLQPIQENEPEIESESDTESPTEFAKKEFFHDTLQQIPTAMTTGWWRINESEELQALMRNLNTQGVRERTLLRSLQRSLPSLENILAQSSPNKATHGEFFRKEPLPDAENNVTTKCDVTSMVADLECEAFEEVVSVAKTILAPNQKGTQQQNHSGRGRPRKSQSTAPTVVAVKGMPQIDEFGDDDVSEADENGRVGRAKKLLADVAYTLAARKLLQPPFEVVPSSEADANEEEEQNGESSSYEFSKSFLQFIQTVEQATNFSALKLRLLQLESLSTIRFQKEGFTLASPKKACRNVEDPEFVSSTCRQLLDALREHEDSAPFNYPVSRVDYPSYFEIIESPIDFQTIDNKICQNCYRSLGEFANDVRLVFSNCREFNADGSVINDKATRLKRWFERRFKQLTN